jgi:hypothetical protein
MGTTPQRIQNQYLLRLLVRGFTVSLAVAAYALVLNWVYREMVSPNFGYMGYGYRAPDSEYMLYAYLAATLTAFALPSKIKQPSALVLWILYVVGVAPSILVPPYTTHVEGNQALFAGLAIAASYSVAALITRRTAPPKPLKMNLSSTSFWLLVAALSAGVYGVIAATIGIRLQFVSLLDVYDVRDEYKAGLAGGAGIVGYLVSTQANIINPMIITRGIYSRRWGLVLLGGLGQAVLFSGTGFKTIIFSVPAMFAFALIFRCNLSPKAVLTLWGATIMSAAAAIIDRAQDLLTYTSLFTRRFLLTPGMLTSAYISFYNDNDFAYLSHSILEPWIQNQYQFAPARMIGLSITGNSNAAFNANIFADGYANFGYAGMGGAAVVLGVYLRFLDRAAYGLPVAVSGLILIMPAITLSNTSVLTAMLTHGLLAAVFILAVAPRSGWGRKPRREVLKRARRARRRVPSLGAGQSRDVGTTSH